MKRCSKCGEEKALSEFYKDKSHRDGLDGMCKVCCAANSKDYYKKNRDKLKLHYKDYRAKNKNKIAANSKDYYKKNRDKQLVYQKDYGAKNKNKIAARRRAYHIQKKYNLSYHEYERLLVSQNYRCAICGGDNNGKILYVDHNHRSGAVRGLLCNNCNLALGNMRDSIELLRKAAFYLFGYMSRETA